MNGTRAERILSFLYIFAALSCLTSLVCMVTVWQYWTWILNYCISVDCGCILYGKNTHSAFMGGDVNLCHFSAYGLIPGLVFGLCFGGYHGYRCCIDKSVDASVRVYSRNLENEDGATVVVRAKRRAPYKHWVPATCLTVLLGCLSLSHAIITTDGYYKTCEQYRKRLIQILNSAGRETEVLHDRLSCGAIFDFMDYLHSDPNTYDYKKFDTGFILGLALASTWLSSCSWIVASSFSVISSRKPLCCKSETDSAETETRAQALTASTRSMRRAG